LATHLLHRNHTVVVFDICPDAVHALVSSLPMHCLDRVRVVESVVAVAEQASQLVLALPTTLQTTCEEVNHSERSETGETDVVAQPSPSSSSSPFDLTPLHTTLSTLSTFIQHHATTHPFAPLLLCSTFTPGTTDSLQRQYPLLHLAHLPEFLSASTATVDLAAPRHDTLLVGVPDGMPASVMDRVRRAVSRLGPHPPGTHHTIDTVRAVESETTKLCCNAFYATKVQVFNEFYYVCQRAGVHYPTMKRLMVRYGWVHPMHTDVPGADGTFGFGGKCLPKDLGALVGWVQGQTQEQQEQGVPVLTATQQAHHRHNNTVKENDGASSGDGQ
jgi:UDP-glucose 6-dehydrogenase